jgi:hypothetical protein
VACQVIDTVGVTHRRHRGWSQQAHVVVAHHPQERLLANTTLMQLAELAVVYGFPSGQKKIRASGTKTQIIGTL